MCILQKKYLSGERGGAGARYWKDAAESFGCTSMYYSGLGSRYSSEYNMEIGDLFFLFFLQEEDFLFFWENADEAVRKELYGVDKKWVRSYSLSQKKVLRRLCGNSHRHSFEKKETRPCMGEKSKTTAHRASRAQKERECVCEEGARRLSRERESSTLGQNNASGDKSFKSLNGKGH